VCRGSVLTTAAVTCVNQHALSNEAEV
jgi:hypothetical protein